MATASAWQPQSWNYSAHEQPYHYPDTALKLCSPTNAVDGTTSAHKVDHINNNNNNYESHSHYENIELSSPLSANHSHHHGNHEAFNPGTADHFEFPEIMQLGDLTIRDEIDSELDADYDCNNEYKNGMSNVHTYSEDAIDCDGVDGKGSAFERYYPTIPAANGGYYYTRAPNEEGHIENGEHNRASFRNEFGAQVAREYLALFNFTGLRIDAALRKFLAQFCLVGESQQRERVLSHFSQRYHHCNPGMFLTEDEVHTLTCALMLLNSDLHSPNIRKRMTCHEFINNLSQAGYTYKRDLLKTLYAEIKAKAIEWAKEDVAEGQGVSGEGHASQQSSTGPLSEGTPLEQQVDYKKGWLMRKCQYEDNGKRTPFGRRSWRMFFGTIKGLVLYLHKDEHGFKRGQYQTYRNAIKLHHAVAGPVTSTHYNGKRQHVFRLRTAAMSELLFQTSDSSEVQSWVDALNFVSACFSSAALPAPVSNMPTATFQRPLLPSAHTRLTMSEQLREHEQHEQDITEQLTRLRAHAPPLNSKGRTVQQYFYTERYLEEEKARYACYVSVLSEKLSSHVVNSSSSYYSSNQLDHSTNSHNLTNNNNQPKDDSNGYVLSAQTQQPNGPMMTMTMPDPPQVTLGMSRDEYNQAVPAPNNTFEYSVHHPRPGVIVVSAPHHYLPGGSNHSQNNTSTTDSSSQAYYHQHSRHRDHNQPGSSTSGSVSLAQGQADFVVNRSAMKHQIELGTTQVHIGDIRELDETHIYQTPAEPTEWTDDGGLTAELEFDRQSYKEALHNYRAASPT